MKIRSAVPENGCLVFCGERKKNNKKQQKNICKTYTHPPHRQGGCVHYWSLHGNLYVVVGWLCRARGCRWNRWVRGRYLQERSDSWARSSGVHSRRQTADRRRQQDGLDGAAVQWGQCRNENVVVTYAIARLWHANSVCHPLTLCQNGWTHHRNSFTIWEAHHSSFSSPRFVAQFWRLHPIGGAKYKGVAIFDQYTAVSRKQ